MVDCLEVSHDMVDHGKYGNLNFIYVFEYELEDIQTIDVVEEELELSLNEGYALMFKGEHDSSTLEPTVTNPNGTSLSECRISRCWYTKGHYRIEVFLNIIDGHDTRCIYPSTSLPFYFSVLISVCDYLH